MLVSHMYMRLRRVAADRALAQQLVRVQQHLKGVEVEADSQPVLFFNASTRIHKLSLNGAFGLLANWAVRLSGIPTVQLICRAGMRQCMLGTDPDNADARPPCQACVSYSESIYSRTEQRWIEYSDRSIPELDAFSLEELIDWKHDLLPLGELCLPTLRWALRRHSLEDDQPTRRILRQYLRSAASLVHQFEALLNDLQPRSVVVFNGITYPEALLREQAIRREIPVVTHEVGLRPNTAFFSHGHATAYPIEVPPEFQLTPSMDRQLDDYLSERFEGRFTMAGVRFWPELHPLPEELGDKIQAYEQTVVAFTNVIFDTSQIHANTLYSDMFQWLADLQQVAAANPSTLFIVRAHPDENRPGKQSRESVSNWMAAGGMLNAPNVEFLAPDDLASSYELIRLAKLVLVYNSSVGLEASVMGVPVLCAARARYTHMPIVYLPETSLQYQQMLTGFLSNNGFSPPEEFGLNARRFLYYQLFHASLDLSRFLESYPDMPGFVTFSRFAPEQIEHSSDLQIIQRGIIERKHFVH